MKMFCFLYLLVILLLVKLNLARYVDSNKDKSNCGYKSCHPTKEGYVNIHLIPHSHDDVGWVKTVEQFYYGNKPDIYDAGVIYIYDNVLKSVEKSKDRRFIYVETAFFWKWWQEQSQKERGILKELVNNGQIEFTGGGWSMNDEAVTNYQSIIDQMTWGLKKLNDTFGDCGRPKIGWQIDPFGHSSEMASIFAQLRYDGLILARIDSEDKEDRRANKTMEMVWRGSKNLGRNTDIFTSVLYDNYDAPAGFCFDVLCTDEPLVDNVDSAEYNIAEKAEDFINDIQNILNSFQTSNVLVPMGRDFAYQNADKWFKNIDKLIKYINNKEIFNNRKYHLIYSTPSCYTAAVRKETEGILSSPLKTDDFLPYASDPHSYWTGFYTSRPSLKRYERMGNNFLQICKQLYALTNLPTEFESKLDSLREAMGVMQHHDAITGTEKENVAYDYARLLDIGITNCENVTDKALSLLTNAKQSNFHTCLLANISQCAISENYGRFVVSVYNPLSSVINKYVRLPVYGTSYSITDPDGKLVPNQILPIAMGVRNIIGRTSKATLELVFQAKDIPPLGFKTYFIQNRTGNDVTAEDLSLWFDYSNNEGLGFSIDPSTGFINKIEMNNVYLNVHQQFWHYNGATGHTDLSNRASGAYVFRPFEVNPITKISDTARFEVYKGEIVTEIHQWFSELASQVIRIYKNEKYVEFDWVVGRISIVNSREGSHGKEIISRFSTPLKSNSTFYTDSNGREMMKRIRNYRPTWNIIINETESSNYYPITSKIMIRDEEENMEFAVLTDRAEGGSSLEDGDVELMLLRHTLADDQLGVEEALTEIAYNEPIVVRGSHYVVLGPIHITKSSSAPSIAVIEREIVSQKLLDSWIFLSTTTEKTFESYRSSHTMQFSGLNEALPKNVQIMTLEPWTPSTYLLRLEHIYEKGLDPVFSQPVSVNIEDIFTTFEIKSIRETTLGGNQWLDENERLKFKSAFQSDDIDYEVKVPLNSYQIHLEPMQYRTFIIEVKPMI